MLLLHQLTVACLQYFLQHERCARLMTSFVHMGIVAPSEQLLRRGKEPPGFLTQVGLLSQQRKDTC